jgi:hypothetical protein
VGRPGSHASVENITQPEHDGVRLQLDVDRGRHIGWWRPGNIQEMHRCSKVGIPSDLPVERSVPMRDLDTGMFRPLVAGS